MRDSSISGSKNIPAKFFSAGQLSADLAAFGFQMLERFVARFMPTGCVPGFLSGVRLGPDARADLISVLGALHQLGFESVAGLDICGQLTHLLGKIDGKSTDTFYSFRVAETLLHFGPFEGNLLLRELSLDQRNEVALACDSTVIYEGSGKLNRRPNYWAVLARTELARQRLGLLASPDLLEESIARIVQLLSVNPHGFFDDSPDALGCYDIYSGEMALFLEPLADKLGPDLWCSFLRRQLELLSQISLENGASVAWGRSIGLHSLLLTLDLAAAGLRHGLAADPAWALSLAQHAFEQITQWYSDGLTAAHCHRSLSSYRRNLRRVQMSLDGLILAIEAASALRLVENPQADFSLVPAEELFADRDLLIPLDHRGAALWSYRNRKVAFQLPFVHAHNADYVPWFRSPGYLGSPVDTDMVCGVPRIWFKGFQFTTHGFPASIEKYPHGLRVIWNSFRSLSGQLGNEPPVEIFPGRREVTYHIDPDGSISAEETICFQEIPEAVGLQFAEDVKGFRLGFTSTNLHHRSVIEVAGIVEWRTYWGELRRTHEIDFEPATEIHFSWKIQPL